MEPATLVDHHQVNLQWEISMGKFHELGKNPLKMLPNAVSPGTQLNHLGFL